MRPSTATGGIAAPLPSKTTTSGSRSAARAAAASTLDVTTAPARPPPARRHPIVGQVDDDVDVREHRVEGLDQRHAVVVVAAQLFGAAGEPGPDDVVWECGHGVAHDRR